MKWLLPLILSTSLFATELIPPTIEQANKGKGIAIEADKRDTGFADNTADLEMVLGNRQGQKSVRHMRNKTLEMTGDGDKLLVLFDQPRDVKGTAFLAFTHKAGPDDQWLYLPALKRVKRIASNNKSGPFMGSEFAYEDLTSPEVEKYTYKYVGEEFLKGDAALVVERYPVDPRSGYTRQIVYYHQETYRIMKIAFFDRKNAPLKTLTYSDYKKYLGQYWRANNMYMENLQTGKTTELRFSGYQFKVGLTDRDLDRNSLKRAR